MARAIDAEQYMELLKEQYLHMGTAWGNCFFGSEKQAEAALRREQDG